MSGILDLIKSKLKGSTAMSAGGAPMTHGHDHAHGHGGCCGGHHAHDHGHDHDHGGACDDDTTTPGKGGCCG